MLCFKVYAFTFAVVVTSHLVSRYILVMSRGACVLGASPMAVEPPSSYGNLPWRPYRSRKQGNDRQLKKNQGWSAVFRWQALRSSFSPKEICIGAVSGW